MVDSNPTPGCLTVLIRGAPIGTVIIKEWGIQKVFGRFVPGPGFEPYRRVFEAAVEQVRQFEATSTTEPCDYQLWDQLMADYGEINRLEPVFAEFPIFIEEFAIEADWSVEVTFGRHLEATQKN